VQPTGLKRKENPVSRVALTTVYLYAVVKEQFTLKSYLQAPSPSLIVTQSLEGEGRVGGIIRYNDEKDKVCNRNS
jgi:hypothetical protein